eukprot:TRINITY_DN5309_c0_g1_i1.p1 TRINITY_DN5309_c0_g1~~TRINITY_DN5309_c0_g1_i1.p1  ORF type:complete len:170 (-),score=61.21 TRINITY_DN5309_c0_g1_i1:90-599(-)
MIKYKTRSDITSTMSLQIRKAQKEMEESSNYKQFFAAMKEIVPTVEVIVDSESIKKLEGTGRYNGNDEATPLVLFNVLRGYFWKGISNAFRDALNDDMAKEAAADAIKRVTVTFVQNDEQKGYGWDLAKAQDKDWTLKVIKNWKGLVFDTEFNTYPNAPEIKDQLLKSL